MRGRGAGARAAAVPSAVIGLILTAACGPDRAFGTIACRDLYPAMYCCTSPQVNEQTQSAVGCTRDRTVSTRCYARDGVTCDTGNGQGARTFHTVDQDQLDADTNAEVEVCGVDVYNISDTIFNTTNTCAYIDPDNLHKFSIAMVLSVFFGPLGIDRFYLGYYGTGLAKLSTGGFLCLWWFVDIVLIALQILTPADGTDYYLGYYESRFRGLSTPGAHQGGDGIYEDFTCPA
eukprot:m.20181 g.20181  ORF g.20181 m.20181 type:complete len:232 (+) comp3763_c0_seq2:96-791(+)